MLAGELMKGGIMIRSLFEFSNLLIGHIRGGLAHVNVLASMFFGGITGSAVADVSALGPIEIQMMKEAGYDVPFATGVTIASSVMGPIIPPSILMIVYAYAVPGVSVGALFLAGVMPGIFIGLSLMCAIYITSKKRNYPRKEFVFDLRHFITTFKDSILSLMMPVIVIGGIISGAFTPTESAGIAILYAFIVGKFVTKDITFQNLPGILLRASIMAGSVLIIVGFASVFAWILTTQQVPQMAASIVLKITKNPIVFLLFINIFLLIVGCFLEGSAAIIIIAPIFAPIAAKLGIDPLHFGVLFVVNLCIGLITPPVGLCLFVGCTISNISLEKLIKASMPFIVAEICVLFLVTYVPAISLVLPRILM
jgi:tripartite ATP-independent transporter DctM subunit